MFGVVGIAPINDRPIGFEQHTHELLARLVENNALHIDLLVPEEQLLDRLLFCIVSVDPDGVLRTVIPHVQRPIIGSECHRFDTVLVAIKFSKRFPACLSVGAVDNPDLRVFNGFRQTDDPVVVCERERLVAEVGGPRGQLLGLRGAVEERVR